MPKVSRRSTAYRPFITCDDPRTVVECRNVRNPPKIPTRKKIESKGFEIMEDSLVKLSSVEKDSRNVSGSTKKPRKKVVESVRNDEDLQETRFHGRRVSGSRRDPIKEINELVMDGVSRKNAHLHHSSVPLTSSSQSTILCSSNSSWKKNRKPNRLNLIEKLMGLEDAFPRSLNEKVVDLESPKEIKHELHSRKLDWRRRTVVKMIEAVNFRGLFKNSLVNRVTDSNERWEGIESDDRSLISPLRFSCLNLEHPVIPKTRGDLDLKSAEMLCNMRIRSNPLAQAVQNDTFEKTEAREVKAKEMASPPIKTKSQDGALKSKRSKGAHSKVNRQGDSHAKVIKGAATFVNDDLKCKDDNAVVNSIHERKPILRVADTMAVAQLNGDVDNNASQIEITDYVADDWSYPSESSTSTKDEFDIKESRCFGSHVEENKNYVDHESSVEVSTLDNKLKALLLSSLSFVRSVEELLGMKLNTPAYEIDSNDLSVKLLLDTASEIMEFHASQKMRLRTHYYTSLDLILDKVCVWFKDLSCYEKVGENNISDDNILLLVKRDLSSSRMGIGVWGIGWRSARSSDEFEEITRGIDELILSELVDEILVNLSSVCCKSANRTAR